MSNNNPIYLYLSDRKGWATVPEQIDSLYILRRIKDGAKFLAGDKAYFTSERGKGNFSWVAENYLLIKDDKDYFVIRLIRNN